MELTTVKNPAKIKKIKPCLNSDWVMKGSAGHMRSLPNDNMEFKPPKFPPQYLTAKNKHKTINELRSLADEADKVILSRHSGHQVKSYTMTKNEVLDVYELFDFYQHQKMEDDMLHGYLS